MKQPRSHSAMEAGTNIVAGIILQYVIGITVIRAQGFPISATQNLALTGVMTVASFARQYGIRRLFNEWSA